LRDLLFGSTPGFLGRGMVDMGEMLDRGYMIVD
jgi:hypothetical protein